MSTHSLPDLDRLGIAQLRQLIELAESKITQLQDAGRETLLSRLASEAEQLGLSLDDLLSRPTAKRGRPRGNGKHHNPEELK